MTRAPGRGSSTPATGAANTHGAAQPSAGGDDAETQRARAIEQAYASLTLGAEVDLEDPVASAAWLTSAGVHPEDQRAILQVGAARLGIYRTLVRGNIEGAIELAIPRTIARLGRAAFDRELAAWLAERGPRTHYLRDVTSEFLDFCESRWQRDPELPDYLSDLARHEALSIVIASEQSRVVDDECGELALDAPVRFIEAARLVHYRHAVHRLSEAESSREAPDASPVSLLVYRSPEHDVRYLELTPLAASILDHLLCGHTLQQALLSGCEVLGVRLTQAVLEGTSKVLADLAERGALLGAGDASSVESISSSSASKTAEKPLRSG